MSHHILFVVPYVPNRIRIRPYNFIKGMARRGMRVTLATLWESEAERDDLDHLAAEGIHLLAQPLVRWRKAWNLLRALPSVEPLQANFAWNPALVHSICQFLSTNQVDVIHVEHLRGAKYGLALQDWIARQSPSQSPQFIWDSVDCISSLFQQASHGARSRKGRWMARAELGRTRRYERWLLEQFNPVLVTTERDKGFLMALQNEQGPRLSSTSTDIRVVGMGVDLSYFSPPSTPRLPANILMHGKMSYHANVTAARFLVEEVMPFVWRDRPEVQVWLVGKEPPTEVQGLARPGTQPNAMGTDLAGGQVVVTGTVPDVRPYLQKATLAVAPLLYGAGVQNKALEAMACGTPLITTERVAASLGARAGEHLIVAAEEPAAFARAILDLLADEAKRVTIGGAGRRFVEQTHDWDIHLSRLIEIYDETLSRRAQ